MLQEMKTTIKLLITLIKLKKQAFSSEFKDFTIRTKQLIKLSIASMLP